MGSFLWHLEVRSIHLNEDDLVMFLCLANLDGSLRPELFRFWWWYMDVNVLLDGGSASETAAEAAAATSSET